MRSFRSAAISVTLSLGLVTTPFTANAQTPTPTTPIQHIVVIFGENVSFDHYFATYPTALNSPGQPRFIPLSGTPAVNGLSGPLLTNNPNLNSANGTGAANPFRFSRGQALTADMNHSDAPEQEAYDRGAMDLFPKFTGSSGGTTLPTPPVVTTKGEGMGYFDGNTVTALWNYAQNFALSDSRYNTQFGPSTPGAINLISGQTNGIIEDPGLNAPSSDQIADGQGCFTMVGDSEPLHDACSKSTSFNAELSGKNVGDLLNSAGLSWGWFQGGFDLTITNPNGSTGCSRSTVSPTTGLTEGDYVEHHQPFQYYASTRNPNHTRPTSVASIGLQGDAGNHQYDTHDFFDSLKAGNLAAVSFLKAPSYQDAHPGNSNPLDEQAFVVNVINTLQQSAFWSTTAVIIDYDDSDGWYDHQMGSIVNGSFTTDDSISGTNACGVSGSTAQLAGPNSGGKPVQGRCMFGPRTPLLVISPWAKPNSVDHTVTNQASPLLFIEQNWNLGLIGGGSADAISNPINNMFNFSESTPQNPNTPVLSTITGELQ